MCALPLGHAPAPHVSRPSGSRRRRRSGRPGGPSGRSACCAASSSRSPFLAAAIVGFTSLASLQYQETFHLDAVHRAYLIAPIQLFDLARPRGGRRRRHPPGATRHRPRPPHAGGGLARGRRVLLCSSLGAPNVPGGPSSATPASTSPSPSCGAACSPRSPSRFRRWCGPSASPSARCSCCPASSRCRSSGRWVTRWLLLRPARPGPIFVIGGLIVASAGGLIGRDVQDVRTSMRTRNQMLADRQAGRLPLLAVRELSVGDDGSSWWPTWPLRSARARLLRGRPRTAPAS